MVTAKFDAKEAIKFFDEVGFRAKVPRVFFEHAADVLRLSILRNFRVGGRPEKWVSLAPSTIAGRIRAGTWGRAQPILWATGVLRGSIGSIKIFRQNELEYGTDDYRAAILHFGGDIHIPEYVHHNLFGKGIVATIPAHTVHIPERPFVIMQESDADHLIRSLDTFLFTAGYTGVSFKKE